MNLVTVNNEGCYSLTERGYAALTTIESAAGYYKMRSAQKRSFYLNLIVCVLLNIGALWTVSQLNNYVLWYGIILPVTVAWMAFYSYWTFSRRRIRLRQ